MRTLSSSEQLKLTLFARLLSSANLREEDVLVCSEGRWPSADWSPSHSTAHDSAVVVVSGTGVEQMLPAVFVVEGKRSNFPEGYRVEITRGGAATGRNFEEIDGGTEWRDWGRVVDIEKEVREGAAPPAAAHRVVQRLNLTTRIKEQVQGKEEAAPGRAKRRRDDAAPESGAAGGGGDVHVCAELFGYVLGSVTVNEAGKAEWAQCGALHPRMVVEILPKNALHPTVLDRLVVGKMVSFAREGDIEGLRSMKVIARSVCHTGSAVVDLCISEGPASKPTALAAAARMGKYDTARFLLEECSADANARLPNGSTALHQAAYHGGSEEWHSGELEGGVLMMRLLLAHKADPNLATYPYAWTSLHNASAQLNRKGFDFLKSLHEASEELPRTRETRNAPDAAPLCSFCARYGGGPCSAGSGKRGCAYALFPPTPSSSFTTGRNGCSSAVCGGGDDGSGGGLAHVGTSGTDVSSSAVCGVEAAAEAAFWAQEADVVGSFLNLKDLEHGGEHGGGP